MDREKLIRQLREYTQDELVYRRFYEQRENPVEWKNYYHELEKYVREQYAFLKEYPFIHLPETFSEQSYDKNLSLGKGANIRLDKHLRYTPVFEHRRTFFEILYVQNGTCPQTLDGERQILRTGDVCFIPPNARHTIEVFDDSIVIYIHIRRDTFEDIFFNTLRYSNILSDFFMSCLYSSHQTHQLTFPTGEDPLIRDIILGMYQEVIEEDHFSWYLLDTQLQALFIQLLRHYGECAFFGKERDRKSTAAVESSVLPILSYINDHYRDCTLQSTAEEFHYSTAHCTRLIKKATGTGFLSFVRKIRTERAVQMLRATSAPVSDIAVNIGYESTESFIRAFEKVFGKSPGEYRRDLLRNSQTDE